ncbi:Gfo/Idh/MocA family protein [Elstera cyanobacteriorum]|uniref:Gfo/Idh/MocA family protein n=1 Tax=Elstera cyanobacteriorum TaxID=2022747 RepID=UPI0023574D51|nr:Gfo/Idh/MocA family oxidoreductase [Elstera cyanobacteriorum]MCK6442195.1 Gfo/Idh/MocA family oxidoreductase [Elstera cyanobacteriorum]
MTQASGKRRVALIGTGNRGTKTWGKELLDTFGDQIEIVGICDHNPIRRAYAADFIGSGAPLFDDLTSMLTAVKPDTVIVCTRDCDHDRHAIEAMEAGADVIVEKPMATTAEKCARILEAQKRTGRRVDVGFNYRHAPTSTRIKQELLSGKIGEVVSVDFHWYLDTKHGADYFRRWHANRENSGSLFVHKATHHFDLLNWYLASAPQEVFARASLRNYGKNGVQRGTHCSTCPGKSDCAFPLDVAADPWLNGLYGTTHSADGYHRDQCVFRPEIDIPDTMTADILYENGVQVAYSLNTFMPIEGYHLAFNGTKGRIEIRQYEDQPWDEPDVDTILVIQNDRSVEKLKLPFTRGGHFGGDVRLQRMIVDRNLPDPYAQRADARAGALSVFCGVAALKSADSGVSVKLADLPGWDLVRG